MPFANFEDFEKAFLDATETKIIKCGELGELTIREPAAIAFEPIDAYRRALIERAELDVHDPADQALIPEQIKEEKQIEEWPRFSYLKFSPQDRADWFANCADMICATVTNGNGKLLFEGREEFVRSWPGGLLTQVSDEIVQFVRGDPATENPTTT
jgi:hypothetical protein